jgi:hypothetical protein
MENKIKNLIPTKNHVQLINNYAILEQIKQEKEIIV